ncbi:MAG: hypothetical protein KBD00_02130 [Candidatus Peribacteraceae bacterium]|nr:hypothetical protein [Candidatus Peribacteraceae bacterium]
MSNIFALKSAERVGTQVLASTKLIDAHQENLSLKIVLKKQSDSIRNRIIATLWACYADLYNNREFATKKVGTCPSKNNQRNVKQLTNDDFFEHVTTNPMNDADTTQINVSGTLENEITISLSMKIDQEMKDIAEMINNELFYILLSHPDISVDHLENIFFLTQRDVVQKVCDKQDFLQRTRMEAHPSFVSTMTTNDVNYAPRWQEILNCLDPLDINKIYKILSDADTPWTDSDVLKISKNILDKRRNAKTKKSVQWSNFDEKDFVLNLLCLIASLPLYGNSEVLSLAKKLQEKAHSVSECNY